MNVNEQTPANNNDIAEFHDQIREIELEGYELRVKKARNALFWAAGLIFAGEMIAMIRGIGQFDTSIFITALIESGIFILLALWTRKKPYTAILAGLITFITFIILAVVINTLAFGAEGALRAIVGGIIVKIVILVALIRPLKDAKELQKAKEEKNIL
ncbi:MAG: hypothetical protein IPJ81_13345 [Chitinophagaceae bacterium]|nr:hypothetical protein [Chitinophagaceae bacterium]